MGGSLGAGGGGGGGGGSVAPAPIVNASRPAVKRKTGGLFSVEGPIP